MSDQVRTERRCWFDENISNLLAAAPPELLLPSCACPCCGYPTLHGRETYEICPLCWWEDDGQDDSDADEVLGGPNGKYSLTAARRNFATFGVMFLPQEDTRVGGPDDKQSLDLKRELITLFDAMREPAADLSSHWRRVSRALHRLDLDLKRRLGWRRLL